MNNYFETTQKGNMDNYFETDGVLREGACWKLLMGFLGWDLLYGHCHS